MRADEDTPVRSPTADDHSPSPQHPAKAQTDVATSKVHGSHQARAEHRSGRPNSASKKLDDPDIGIILSQAQIEHVIASSIKRGPPSIAALLAGLDMEQTVSMASLEKKYLSEIGDERLSRSLLRGLLIFSCFVDGMEHGLSEIAKQLEMHTSTTHRYVTTLLAFGLIEQIYTRKYRLVDRLRYLH